MKRIWVSRDEPPGGPLCTKLAAAGLQPVLEPVLKRVKMSDAADEIRQLGPGDWLVLTSAFAAESIALPEARQRPRIAAVGEATARAARARGLDVDLIGFSGGETLFDELRRSVNRGTIFFARSALAAPPRRWRDVRVVAPVVYETIAMPFDRGVLERADIAAITSPSAAAAIGPMMLPVASIGATTSEAVRRLGMNVWVEAPEPTFEALARAIAERLTTLRETDVT